jgi:hypothetical protein
MQILGDAILLLRRIQWDIETPLEKKYQLFLSDIAENWIFSTDFQKIKKSKYEIYWKSVQWWPLSTALFKKQNILHLINILSEFCWIQKENHVSTDQSLKPTLYSQNKLHIQTKLK